ncbi:MAG TPA: AAA family ATPase [Acidimicrobiales bacterium]
MKGGFNFYRGTGQTALTYFREGHEFLEVDGEAAARYFLENPEALTVVETWQMGHELAPAVAITGQEFVAWVDGLDYVTGESRGTHRTGIERKRLRFVEFGINNPKSLSLLESQDLEFHLLMEAVRDQQRHAALAYISAVAVTRVGPMGSQAEVGNLRLESTHVNHSTSREGDPHFHQHVMVNAKAFDPASGKWRSLHTASLRQHIKAINAEGALVLQSMVVLREALATRGLTLGLDGEIDELRSLTKRFSKRTTQIDLIRERLETEWKEENPGRLMSPRQRSLTKALAWNEGRRAKSGEYENYEEFAERIRLELATSGWANLKSAPVHVAPPRVVSCDRAAMTGDALARLESQHSTWNAADVAEVVRLMILREGVADTAEGVAELTSALSDAVTTASYSVLDPKVMVPQSTTKYLTSQRIRDEERQSDMLLAMLSLEAPADVVGMAQATAAGLTAGQAEAVGAMASDQRLAVIIGPAGTGKTTMMKSAKRRLDHQGRTTVVVSPSLQGALVAGRTIGSDSSSLSRLLFVNGWRWDEFDRWTREPADPDGSSRLDTNTVVVVDEASMVSRSMLHALLEIVNEAGASLRLVGDPEQLGAVGRGGVIQNAAQFVNPVELDLARRFETEIVNEAGVKERVLDVVYAALMEELRLGGTPRETARELVDRGCVNWHADYDELEVAVAESFASYEKQTGSVGVTVATNEMARGLSTRIRSERVAAVEVDDHLVASSRDGDRVGKGDRVVVRRNDLDLGVANRQQFTVTGVDSDGALRVRADVADGAWSRKLPGVFVRAHVELGYAVTGHGQQGATFDYALAVAGSTTDRAGLYVSMSRGRLKNVVHLVAGDRDEAIDILARAIATRRGDDGLGEATRLAELDAVMIETTSDSELTRWRDLLASTALDDDTVHSILRSPALGAVVSELESLEEVGVDVEALVPALVAEREFDSAQDPARVLHWRIVEWEERIQELSRAAFEKQQEYSRKLGLGGLSNLGGTGSGSDNSPLVEPSPFQGLEREL